MKHLKKALCIIISILILSSFFTINFYALEQTEVYSGTTGDCAWEYDKDTKTLTISGEGDIDDYYRNESAPWLHLRDKTEKLIIGDYVEHIGKAAFAGFISLKQIVFGIRIQSIDEYAFANCTSIEELHFSDSIKKIYNNAFINLTSLKSLQLPINLQYLASYSFNDCSNLESISLPMNITQIYGHTFSNCSSLKTVSMYHNVKNIYDDAFSDCDNLTDIIYYGTEDEWNQIYNRDYHTSNAKIHFENKSAPDSGCSFTYENDTLTISGTTVINYTGYAPLWADYRLAKKIVFSDGIIDIGNCLDYFPDLEEVQLPNGLNYFYGFTKENNLKKIIIPEGTKYIGNYHYNSTLENIIINEGTKTIHERAFMHCTALKQVSIPISVKTIDYSAFNNCDNLTDVYYNGIETDWDKISINKTGNDILKKAKIHFADENSESVFRGTTGDCVWRYDSLTKTITITGEGDMEHDTYKSGAAGPTSHSWDIYKNEIKKVVFGDKVHYISKNAFSNCENLEEVEFSDSIRIIDSFAFSNCTSLKKAELKDNIRIIEFYAFYYCINLETVNLPDSLMSLGSGAFSNCKKITEIIIPYNIRTFGGIFSNCDSLETIHLNGLYEIGNYEFENCNSLKNLYFNGTETQLSHFPERIRKIPNIYFVNKPDPQSDINYRYDEDTKTLYFEGNGVMRDNSAPWSEYSSLASKIVINEGVKYISANAFNSFSKLKAVELPESLEEIGQGAFANSTIKNINIPKNVFHIYDNAFSNCYKLEKVQIEGNIHCLPEYAFYHCSSLNTIYLPESLQKIGSYAFTEDYDITDIYYGGSRNKWDSIIISSEEDKNLLDSANIHFALQDETITTAPEQNPTLEPKTDPIATTIPETTAETFTEPAENTTAKTTTEFITQPENSTAPETTSEPVTEPIETTTAETTAVIFTEPEETTIEYIPTEPATNTEITTAPVITTAAAVFTEPETTLIPTEFTTAAYEQTTLPIIIPTESLSPLLPTTPIITEPIETKPQNIIPPKNQNTKTNKKSQKITAKSYSVVLGNKPFPIKAKAKGKISFKTKSKKIITLSKNGKVTIKSVGIAYIRIHAAGNKLYKSADKIITVSIKPPKLKLLSKSGGTNKKYTIYFKKIPNVSGYELLYKAKGEKKYKKIFAKKNSNKFVIKNLKYTKHTIKARAYKKVSKAKLFGAYIKASFGPSA